MANKVFINYRREDSKGEALALRQFFERRMPQIELFVDVDGGIKPGDNYIRTLEQSVAGADVFMCLIGKQWLNSQTASGGRRLDDPNDFVRIEIAAALRRDIPIVPVLIDGVSMPSELDLPDDIRMLAYKQAVSLRHDRFNSDAEGIAAALRAILDGRKVRTNSWRTAAGVAAALAIGLALGNLLLPRLGAGPAPQLPDGKAVSDLSNKLRVAEEARSRAEQATKSAQDALERQRGLAAANARTAATKGGAASSGRRLDAIKARGQLVCGVNTGLAGFALADSKGQWTGIDVDICKAVAAALLGDASKVKYVPLNTQQRFTALQSGEVDVLSRNTTWTLSRDTQLGLDFAGITYYDGQGFMVARKLGVKSARELSGATVCVQPGTTTELNLADYFRANRMQFRPVVIENLQEVNAAFFAGRCDVLTTDASGLAAVLSKDAPNKGRDHMILPEIISKEPLGPAVVQGDPQWLDVVRWTINALIEAEENGITQANVAEIARTTNNPSISRMLGKTPGFGRIIGLPEDWVVRAVGAVGNYGEIWERNIKPLNLPRGLNNLWNKGGLMYAPPIR